MRTNRLPASVGQTGFSSFYLSSLIDGEIRKQLLRTILVLILCVRELCTFNVDTTVPLVKTGVPDSYFGFSIAQHFVFNRAKNLGDATLLVGAPRDNLTDPSLSEKVHRLVRPGTVYRCPYTSFIDDCVPVKIDRDEPVGDLDKNDQWMGVSVTSQGTQRGKALACAHRYKKTSKSFSWGLGICISMTNDLDEDDFWEPCDGKPKDKGHGQYGVCQTGTSASISQDGQLIMGAPGVHNWRGAVFKNVFEDTTRESWKNEKQWYQNNVEEPVAPATSPLPTTGYYAYLGMSVKIGTILDGKKTYVAGAPRSLDRGQVLLFQEWTRGQLKIDPKHYLTGDKFGSSFGYDLAIADFNSDGKEDLAVGAPFYHENLVGGAIYIYINGPEGIHSKTKPLKILSRKMKENDCSLLDCTNARFGFSITSVGDIDKDGYDDLAVGAPFEGLGAVYIFRGSSAGLVAEPSQRIYSGNLPLQHPVKSFGYSLSGGVDLDYNFYPDLAVGAYQSDTVVILRSRPVISVSATLTSSPAKVDPKVTQCLREPARTRTNQNCFELSLCFTFTAEPKDKFMDPIELDYKLEAERFIGAEKQRVHFKGTSYEDVIERTALIKQQGKTQCRPHLVYIAKSNRDFLTPIKLQLTYRLKPIPPPTMYLGQPVPDINSYPVLNEATAGLPLSINFLKQCNRETECISNLKIKASLDELDGEMDRDDDYTLKVGLDKEVKLNIHVTNEDEEEAHETMLNVTLPDSLEFIGTDERGKQFSCTLMKPYVVCPTIGNPLPKDGQVQFSIRLDPSKAVPTAEQLVITAQINTTSREMDLTDDMSVVRLQVIVETDVEVRGLSRPSEIYYSGSVRGASEIRDLNEESIGSQVFHEYEVKNIGGGRVAAATLNIYWPYETEMTGYKEGKYILYLMERPRIEGNGECPVDDTLINPLRIQPLSKVQSNEISQINDAEIPADRQSRTLSSRFLSQINNLHHSGQLTSLHPLVQSSTESYSRISNNMPCRWVYDENLNKDSAAISKRRRRADSSRDRTGLQKEHSDGREYKVNVLDCDLGNTKCHHFKCNIGELLPGQSFVVKLRSRLWNSTFLEDFAEVNFVRVYSKANITIDSSLNIMQTDFENDFYEVMTKVVPGIQIIKPKAVAMWIIILAVLAGLFFLFILAFLLWRCGFFKRHKHDDMVEHRAKLEKDYYDVDT